MLFIKITETNRDVLESIMRDYPFPASDLVDNKKLVQKWIDISEKQDNSDLHLQIDIGNRQPFRVITKLQMEKHRPKTATRKFHYT